MCGFLHGKPHAVFDGTTKLTGNPGSVYTNCETALSADPLLQHNPPKLQVETA